MDIFGGKNRINNSFSFAFIILCISRLLMFFVSFIPFNQNDLFVSLWGFVFSACLSGASAVYLSLSTKQTISVVSAVVMSSAVFYSFSKISYSILISILLGLILSFVSKSFYEKYSVIFCLLIAVLIGMLLGVLYKPFYNVLLTICAFVSGKGALFGVINDFYSVAFSDTFAYIFYHSNFSSAMLIDNKLVSGVMDIFATQKTFSLDVSRYLSGKYFVNMFLPIGLFTALYSKFDLNVKLSFVFVVFTAIITGDVRFLSSFLLLYNPFIYCGYLICVFISYFVARFVDLRIGYIDNGNIVELFLYNKSWGYYIIIGIILTALMYYIVVLILSKFDFDKRMVLPKDVRRIVNALGGIRNIKRIEDGKVLVVDSNLVDILRLDCEIHSNEITLIQNDYDLLQKYF